MKGDLVIPCKDVPKKPLSEMTLEERAIAELLQESSGGMSTIMVDDIRAIPLLLRNRLPGMELVRNDDEAFKCDVQHRPEESTLEEYANTPVDAFGEAMLRGMGWTKVPCWQRHSSLNIFLNSNTYI